VFFYFFLLQNKLFYRLNCNKKATVQY